MAHRIAHLVYVDAGIPLADGRRFIDLYDPMFVADLDQLLGADGRQLPPNPDLVGRDDRYGPVVAPPLRDAVALTNPQAAGLPRTYIAYT